MFSATMPPETDNLKLLELYQADQKDRERVYESAEEVNELRARDAQRKSSLLEMIAQGEVNTANDLYHAAVIMLHGHDPKDFMIAHRFSTLAAIGGHRAARWMVASSLDRFLMACGMPQVYGTQFEFNEEEGKYQLRLPIDDAAILAFEKKFFNVPPVKDRLAQLNGRIKA